jgi:hypothetical protein
VSLNINPSRSENDMTTKEKVARRKRDTSGDRLWQSAVKRASLCCGVWFRGAALPRRQRSFWAAAKGGRPGFDAVLKLRMPVLQATDGLSLEQTAYLRRDRLSWMRFCGLGSGGAVPEANTLVHMADNMRRWCWLDRRRAPA